MKNKICLLVVSAMIVFTGVGCVSFSFPEMEGNTDQKAMVILSWPIPEKVERTNTSSVNGKAYTYNYTEIVDINYYIIYGEYDGKEWYGFTSSEDIIYAEGQALELYLLKGTSFFFGKKNSEVSLVASKEKNTTRNLLFMYNWDIDKGILTDYEGRTQKFDKNAIYTSAINRRFKIGR